MLKIAPSVLAADFARLGEEAESIRLAGADPVFDSRNDKKSEKTPKSGRFLALLSFPRTT